MISAGLHQDALIDVAVIGAGPSGLAAAIVLKEAGVERVVVLEREAQAGGIPRHCSHPPYGLREFGRILKGPNYAMRIVENAHKVGVEIHTATSVTDIKKDGFLHLSTPDGTCHIKPRRVIYATGVREKPRSARLISGARVQGVMNTGALQSMVYLKQRRPFRRPVIVGTELVAFSALMTCRSAGIRPVAMIEAAQKVTARWPSAIFPWVQGVELLTGTRLVEIEGDNAVQAVTVADVDGKLRRIECDGVILTGGFTPEAALAQCGHLDIDSATGGPVVDQWGRCSDPVFFATGNVLRPVETAGRSWAEGRQTGEWVAQDLAEKLPRYDAKPLRILLGDARLKYAMPQLIGSCENAGGMTEIQMRVREVVSGTLIARKQGKPVWQRRLNTRPERRITVPIGEITSHVATGAVEFTIEGG
jgi:thioredoxin reductase